MSRLIIDGGKRLSGTVRVHGAKNSVLPILAATVLIKGECIINDCPFITDVSASIDILRLIGCKAQREGETLIIDASDADKSCVPEEMMRRMRSSIIFMGALAARFKKGSVAVPGGCEIGHRPVDLHIDALSKMGVDFSQNSETIEFSCDKLKGCDIHLSFPSVGATENIILAAATAEGVTRITNAAMEPEIKDLSDFLNQCGAKISGAGTDSVIIEGVRELSKTVFTVMPDRIVASTYIAAAIATRGKIEMENVRPHHMRAVIDAARKMGADIKEYSGVLGVSCYDRPNAVKIIRTLPYPGFPTDAQSQFMAAACLCRGTSVFIENIFDGRYNHVMELVKMGADITVEGKAAIVRGREALSGGYVVAGDLRGGAAIAIAALSAEGRSVIDGAGYIMRGYEDFTENYASLGAGILME